MSADPLPLDPPQSRFRARLTSSNGSTLVHEHHDRTDQRDLVRDRTPSTSSTLRRRPERAIPSDAGRQPSYAGSAMSSSRRSKRDTAGAFGWESAASESGMSGMSVLSAFPHRDLRGHVDPAEAKLRRRERRREKEARRLLEQEEWSKLGVVAESRTDTDPTDSPLRRWTRWMLGNEPGPRARYHTLAVCLAGIVLVRWCVGLGGYSGHGTPPLRGDFEAQRHWLALTSSSLASRAAISIPFTSRSIKLYHPASAETVASVPLREWYSYDLTYWGLDYPPLTAYHSYMLGFFARLSPSTAQYVTLRPPTNSTSQVLANWEQTMSALERDGGMKNWMRSTVLAGDCLVWMTAVAYYCWHNFGKRDASEGRKRAISEKALRRTLVAAATILCQPALILTDNGHFQYNSVMLSLTLWSINAFQSGHDLIGSTLFVASLGFKQMALYYAPGVFAYLLGKCLWLGGRDGLNLFLHLGITVVLAFTALFLPFLSPFPDNLFQALHRIFPFARGLFEDKVANFWCAINIVIKLRTLASVQTLARLSLLMTGLAVLPSTAGVIWISHRLGNRSDSTNVSSASSSTSSSSKSPLSEKISLKSANRPAPTSHLLPHLLLISSLSFFLFSFQVHEKSILLPLMPLTLLMGAREKGYGRLDWEWGVLVNNVAVFSMFPLLKRDGLVTQYVAVTLLWNYLIGYNPFTLRSKSFVKALSLMAYASMLTVHLLELVTNPPVHLPDLFPVLNVVLSAGVFGLAWLWVGKRLAQESWAIGGF
ncbi:dolichyl-P-Glc:Man(9)GlcNAc(2)-PP-dolichol alpha-1,3-glucosyltransferase [Sporobolomyces koalae]|uniref:dolichyl-P-Glc:Man(9)GlcNAc(2)-PP-dolichol alpha-1,3-glucosyltransferase n=1 Tax=Sporobolomyces koalae TaxID=500713 RepID=UPI0031711596